MSYDSGEVTERERLAASRLKTIAQHNRDSINNQLEHQLANYDQANRQNAALRDVQLGQIGRKTEADRFEAQRNLQNAALGLFGSMNQGMNGSTIGNAMYMLNNRNDADNSVYWQQHTDNANQVNNAYQEALNQNQVAKNDTIVNAAKAIRDLEGDLAANLNNINPNLYVAPGTGAGILNAWSPGPYDKLVADNKAKLSGYLMPENAEQDVRGKRNKLLGNDYFGNMINKFNGR